jgi:hypothetical protein
VLANHAQPACKTKLGNARLMLDDVSYIEAQRLSFDFSIAGHISKRTYLRQSSSCNEAAVATSNVSVIMSGLSSTYTGGSYDNHDLDGHVQGCVFRAPFINKLNEVAMKTESSTLNIVHNAMALRVYLSNKRSARVICMAEIFRVCSSCVPTLQLAIATPDTLAYLVGILLRYRLGYF